MPALVLKRYVRSDLAAVYGTEVWPMPWASRMCWRAADAVSAHWWWLVPLALAVLAFPTVYRWRQAGDRADASLTTVLAEELSEGQPMLLAGVLVYPLIGFGVVRALFEPLIRVLDVLGS
jgi:hypothetical protein